MHAKNVSRLKVEYLPPQSLIPNIRNPRKHSKKQIRQLIKSVNQFGFIVPVLVDDQQQVIAGHGRLLAAAEMKMAEVPVIRLDHLTPAEAQAFLIADNKLTENAQWDDALLGEHFAELASLDLDFDLSITGFEIGEIDMLILGDDEKKAEVVEEKPIPEGPAVTKPGDLWLLGKHRLYCGNSLDAESYLLLMNGKKAQMVFTDPPYNVPVNGHVSGLGKVKHREFAMAAGEMSTGQFTKFLQTMCKRLTEKSSDGSIHYICMDWRHIPELMDAAKGCYSEHKNICVWAKDNAGIAARKVNVVVVYKVDRLTRSLADSAKIIEQFDKQGVSFVSVTQQFNTTSSMGRLTLNVLLSFAQFEREVTGERIRDKIAASKKKGMWMGGVVPLGYEVKERKLLVKPADAETVRQIYRLYLELGCVRLLHKNVAELGIRSARGHVISRGALYTMLSNPIYVGQIRHKKQHHEGQHEAIIDPELWEQVQQCIAGNRIGHKSRGRKTEPCPLNHKLFDATGEKLGPVHALKRGRRYRYYISQSLKTGTREDNSHGWRLPGQEIEQVVAQAASQLLQNQDAMTQALLKAEVPAHHYPAILNTAKRVPADTMTMLTDYVQRVELQATGIRLTLSLSPLLPAQANAGPFFLMQDVPMHIKRRGVEMRLVIGQQPSGRLDTTLIKAIARAHRWFKQLATGEASNIAEIAEREGIDRSTATRVMHLAFLAPDIIESILSGRQPANLSLEKLTKQIDLPIHWEEQRQLLGFA